MTPGGARVVYFDKSGRDPDRPVRRRVPDDVPGLDEAKIRYILEVADEYPRLTAAEVYTEIHKVRHDITIDMVRTTLDSRSRTSLRRRFGL
jgi:hypothetical protein